MSKICGIVAGVSKAGRDYITLYVEKSLQVFGSGSAEGFTTDSIFISPSNWGDIKKQNIKDLSELRLGVDIDVYYKGKDSYSGVALIVKNN